MVKDILDNRLTRRRHVARTCVVGVLRTDVAASGQRGAILHSSTGDGSPPRCLQPIDDMVAAVKRAAVHASPSRRMMPPTLARR